MRWRLGWELMGVRVTLIVGFTITVPIWVRLRDRAKLDSHSNVIIAESRTKFVTSVSAKAEATRKC